MNVIAIVVGAYFLGLLLFFAYKSGRYAFSLLGASWPALLGTGIGLSVTKIIWEAGHDNYAVVFAIVMLVCTGIFQDAWSTYLMRCPMCESTNTRKSGGVDFEFHEYLCDACHHDWKSLF